MWSRGIVWSEAKSQRSEVGKSEVRSQWLKHLDCNGFLIQVHLIFLKTGFRWRSI